jgi:hypothetical protein
MENPSAKKSYAGTKIDARAYYAALSQPWCPLLGAHVIFNDMGFQHLIRSKNVQRPRSEQRRRFALLPFVKEIIENPKANVKHHRKETVRLMKIGGKKTAMPVMADFWEFTEERDGRIIKVIIRQFPNGEKHFLSVYEKKAKTSP